MIFHFEHMYIDHQPGQPCFNYRPWKLTELKDVLGGFMAYNEANGGWDSLYLENHDQPRIVGRWASDSPAYREVVAKMLALFHATGRGTLFLYQGQEIGMANPPSWEVEELRDLEEIQYYETVRARGGDTADALRQIQRIGRDNSRTPMQWSGRKNAGFTTGEPWIKVNPDYWQWNVEEQLARPDESVLGFWRRLLDIRKKNTALVHGGFRMLDYENESVYAYTRDDDARQFLVVCSFVDKDLEWPSPVPTGRLILGNYPTEEGERDDVLKLRPFEGRLYCLDM
jgi:oligo-1,6-glucosidase